MNNNTKKEYFIFIDDSGKFVNKNDNHALYGGYLINDIYKKDKFINEFTNAKNKVTKKIEIKGNDIFKKYIDNKKNKNKKDNIENLFFQYKLVDAMFCIWTCKNSLEIPANNEQHAKLKNNQLIAQLLKKIVENNLILSNSSIKIYIDCIYSPEEQLINADLLKKYLNENNSRSKIINFLRFKNIMISEIIFLDSKKWICIQATDIIANFCNKYLNKHKDFNKIVPLFEKFHFKIIGCKFPKIIYNDSILNIKCCWSEFGQVNTTKNKVAGVFLESSQAGQQDKE